MAHSLEPVRLAILLGLTMAVLMAMVQGAKARDEYEPAMTQQQRRYCLNKYSSCHVEPAGRYKYCAFLFMPGGFTQVTYNNRACMLLDMCLFGHKNMKVCHLGECQNPPKACTMPQKRPELFRLSVWGDFNLMSELFDGEFFNGGQLMAKQAD